jgi:CubicO group peptidase (beta-lactamase class C family)
MHLSSHLALLPSLCVFITGTLADFVGPTYPAPLDLSSNASLVAASWKNLTSTLDSYLKNTSKGPRRSSSSTTLSAAEVGNVTFSLGMFSMHDPEASKLQYHHTSPEIAKASHGTHSVQGDSIYRIASMTKLFTVLGGLLTMTDEDWNRPLTSIIPELASFAAATADSDTDADAVYKTAWDQITPWALACQMAGIARQGIAAADLLVNVILNPTSGANTLATEYGLPPANVSDLGTCLDINCTASSYVQEVMAQPPILEPWTSPAYANNGFILLGIAISKLTGKPMSQIYQQSIFDALDMSSSYSSAPTTKGTSARSVIAGDPELGFAAANGLAISSGGLFSATHDLAKFGIAILNSTLLPADATRKWMKPTSHTASLTYAVGAPWEIVRYIHPDPSSTASTASTASATGKVSDLYTKSGDSGYYSSNIVLIPEYGAGFTILSASTNESLRGPVTNLVLDYMTNAVLPALEAQAAQEAKHNFVGTYESESTSTLNSSLTIAFNKSTVVGGNGGLSISRWISNGTDVLASPLFGGIRPRLLPSISSKSSAGGGGGGGGPVAARSQGSQVAFQASIYPQTNSYTAAAAATTAAGIPGVIGPFTGQWSTNFDWLTVDSVHYDGVGVNLFVFDLDATGSATGVTPAAMKAKLERT